MGSVEIQGEQLRRNQKEKMGNWGYLYFKSKEIEGHLFLAYLSSAIWYST